MNRDRVKKRSAAMNEIDKKWHSQTISSDRERSANSI